VNVIRPKGAGSKRHAARLLADHRLDDLLWSPPMRGRHTCPNGIHRVGHSVRSGYVQTPENGILEGMRMLLSTPFVPVRQLFEKGVVRDSVEFPILPTVTC